MTSINVESGIQILNDPRHAAVETFWRFSLSLGSINESEWLELISKGIPAELVETLRVTFDLDETHVKHF